MSKEIEITTEQAERLKELVPPMLDRAFNEGIDKAIEVVNDDMFVQLAGMDERLIKKLQSLKK